MVSVEDIVLNYESFVEFQTKSFLKYGNKQVDLISYKENILKLRNKSPSLTCV